MSESTKKAASKVKDFTEPAKEFSGVVKENYLNGVDFTFSLLEQNIKVLNSQVDQYFDLEKEFISNVSEFYKDVPKNLPFAKDLPYGGGVEKVAEQLDRYTALRKEQVQSARSITEKYTKDARAAAEENVEQAFSLFTDYFKFLNV